MQAGIGASAKKTGPDEITIWIMVDQPGSSNHCMILGQATFKCEPMQCLPDLLEACNTLAPMVLAKAFKMSSIIGAPASLADRLKN